MAEVVIRLRLVELSARAYPRRGVRARSPRGRLVLLAGLVLFVLVMVSLPLWLPIVLILALL